MNDWIDALGESLPQLPSGKREANSVRLDDILEALGPMPGEGLLFGMAYDGLPVLFNISDAVSGSVLVAGDETMDFLSCVAESATRMNNIQLAIISGSSGKWNWLQDKNPSSLVGIFPVWHKSSEDLVLSLASWAHGRRGVSQAVVLIVDDLDEVARQMDFDGLQNLRWLLLRGPSNQVRPIAGLNTGKVSETTMPWIDGFHTKIVGCGGDEFLGVGNLSLSNGDLAVQETGEWVKFWTPEV